MAEEKTIITSCVHNCGGRCLLRVHVKDGKVIRISTDSTEEKDGYTQLRACMQGRSYREKLYHPDRLKYPLKRVGNRGEGKFARISWDEATDLLAGELARITAKFGAESRYINYGTGISTVLSEREFFRRLLSMYGGGYLNYYNSYSSACTKTATRYTFGTAETGSSRDNWQHSKLIILWGHNPAETSFGTNTTYFLRQAKENGAKIIVVDPRYSDSAAALADQWIPLLPTTDNALMDAMIYVMITEKLYDEAFVAKYCLGFNEEQMPDGAPVGNSLFSYIMGQSDGQAKTPSWAENITRVPAGTIQQLARDYATIKPAALLQGWGPQRHAYGEQPVRGANVLAAITGNVGIPGGWASGSGFFSQISLAALPYTNPVKTAISFFTWPDAIVRGRTMGLEDGVKHAEYLKSNIKFIANLAGNCLINQHSDINRTKEILQDESRCEFILVSDEFMTSSAMFADLVLPSTNFLERIDISEPWEYKDYVIFHNQAVYAGYERKTGYDWMCEVAKKLGIGREFSAGRTYQDWARYIVERSRELDPEFPTYEEFSRKGIYMKKTKSEVAFQEQIENFAKCPFPTPSGKIEIFSLQLYRMNNPREIPAIPKYVPSWEGPSDPVKNKYPLQLIGWHSKRSTHSTMQALDGLEDIAPHRLWINPDDAVNRGLVSGDKVRVFNQRGALVITVKVTSRIIPGVVAMPQGKWYYPDKTGVDRGGCLNTLSRHHPTPLAKGNPQHTNLVQVEKIVE